MNAVRMCGTFVVIVEMRDAIDNPAKYSPTTTLPLLCVTSVFYRSYMSYRTYRVSFRNPLQLNKLTQLSDHHSFFTFQPAGERWSVAQLVLALQVIPNLAVCTLTVPTKIAVRDSVDGQVLKAAQQAVLLGNAHFVAQYVETNELLVGIEQV